MIIVNRSTSSCFIVAGITLAMIFLASTFTASAESYTVLKSVDSLEKKDFTFEMDPKTSQSGSFYLENKSDGARLIEISVADAVEGGSVLDYKLSHQKMEGVGKWLTLGTNTLVLDEDEGTTINYEINLRDDATPGDYLGAIIIIGQEYDPDAIIGEEGEIVVGAGAKLVARTAKVVQLTINGKQIFGLDLLERPNLLLNHAEERYGFRYQFLNTGNKHLNFPVELELDRILGKKSTVTSVGSVSVFAGRQSNYILPWRDFKHGIYKAVTRIEYVPGQVIEKEFWFPTFPIVYLVIAGVLLLLLIAIIVYFLRSYLKLRKQMNQLRKASMPKQQAPAANTPKPAPQPKGQAVQPPTQQPPK